MEEHELFLIAAENMHENRVSTPTRLPTATALEVAYTQQFIF